MAKQTFTTGQVLNASALTSLQQTAMGGGSTTAKTASYVLVAADAGTVVQMNSASATTITVNQNLFAQGDSLQIQNVGSGVCTLTAGTATVSTSATLALKQYDAGTLYFNTTSAAFFFAVDAADGMANPLTTTGDIIYSSSGTTAARLGIGSSGQSLVVASGIPSWATASSGLTQIVSASFTASAGLSVNSCFTSTYKNYKVVFRVKASTTAGTISWRWRTSGTDLTSAGYYYGWNLTNNGATTTLVAANAATSIDLGGGTETAVFNNYSYDVFGPQANTQVPLFYGGGTFTNAGQRGFGGGHHTTAGTYDGFSLVTTQNITGEYTVYGYAN